MTTKENRMHMYLNHKIVLWGAGDFGRLYLRQFQLYDVNVIAICDINPRLHGTELGGVPIISPKELECMVKEDDSIVVQITIDTINHVEGEIVTQLVSMGVKHYFPYSEELDYIVDDMRLLNVAHIKEKYTGSHAEHKIPITKIDEELSIYHKNKVIVCGAVLAEELVSLFEYHKVELYAMSNLTHEVPETIHGIKGITIDELEVLLSTESDSIMIQSATSTNEQDVLDYISEKHMIHYISYQEAYQVLSYVKNCKVGLRNSLARDFSHKANETATRELNLYVQNLEDRECTIICMVPKTGDNTLGNTFKKCEITYLNLWHRPEIIKEITISELENIKIITAVRDPIAQVVSTLYEIIANCGVRPEIHKWTSPFVIESCCRKGGDVQYIWDKYLEDYITGKGKRLSNIGMFMERFDQYIIDIRQVPFDKEKGWTIVRQGNIEVFIYQLEKMNEIIPELSEFVGTPFASYEMGNVASDKWIAASYKQAQKELQIPRAYFEMCYNDPYVQHFYSEKDIAKFKERWIGQVVDVE